MARCGFTWRAPKLLPPGGGMVIAPGARIPVHEDRIYVEQKCVLKQGHEGEHLSSDNVIHA